MNPTTLFALGALGIVIAADYARSAAVAPIASVSCRSPARLMTRLELVFGTARTNRAPISDSEWTSFVDNEVTPRFPAGLTVLHGPGQWRDQQGVVTKEQSHIVVVWHEPGRQSEANIESIRWAYKANFDQDSVMRVEGMSCVSF